MDGYGVVTVSKDVSGRIIVAFPYDPQPVAKVRTIDGRKWHKDKKYWSFPHSAGTLENILKAFEGNEIYIDPSLQLSAPVVARDEVLKQSTKNSFPTLEKGGKGGFEDLRRELVSRKYSYKTVIGQKAK